MPTLVSTCLLRPSLQVRPPPTTPARALPHAQVRHVHEWWARGPLTNKRMSCLASALDVTVCSRPCDVFRAG